jgi:dipeptidyl-peptidase-4
MRPFLSFILFFSTIFHATGQQPLLTVAEESRFTATSDYNDVMSFIDNLQKKSENVRVETIARSVGGMDIPLLIIGNPLPATPEEARNSGRIVIYVQGNIHAGEVEGKEALLMFARDLLGERNSPLLENIVFLLCPNFNPDGNEQISPLNRTYQPGPLNGVGVRHNGQFLDLNRDAMKAESPEVRGLLRNVFNKWDPAVFMDCHTTNGSYHVEPVTFTWMVNSNGDKSLVEYMHERMIPAISGTLLNKYGVLNCCYGEFVDMLKPEEGWIYEASDPRYMTNYYGLRNRLAILNENYVYAGYEERVRGCYALIRSLAEYVSANKSDIIARIREADSLTINRGLSPADADSFAIEFGVRPLPEKVKIMTYEAELVSDTLGRRRYQKSDRQLTVTVPYLIDWYGTRNVKFPYAYLLTVPDPEIIELLEIHGITIERLSEDSTLEVERFEISGLKGSPRLNQGHYTNTISGRYVEDTVYFARGTVVIRTAQKLANVAAYLLEPQSSDGLLTWNYLDRYLVPQWGTGFYPYPVYRITRKTDLITY